MNKYHIPVLLEEVIHYLDIQKDKKYIDATLGGGGHTIEILKKGGVVLGLDVDSDVLDYVNALVREKYPECVQRLTVHQRNFREIKEVAIENKFEKVSGILFDLGVSSHQLADGKRGFSFQSQGPLDMRMDQRLQVKAKDLVNILTKGELYELFTKLGEESFSRAISNSIVSARRIKPIETTEELSELIQKTVGRHYSKIHPATKIFQALRIAVNDELNSLKEALKGAFDILGDNGVMLVITFHSLEDRIVKNIFGEYVQNGLGVHITKKPVTPTTDEVLKNRRSRSAKLRVIKKIQASI